MRLFIAINFPKEIKAAISDVREKLKEESWSGNFGYEENLHLTLVFLGECDIRQVEVIKTIIDESKCAEFSLMLENIGFFKRYGGNTWWIGLKEDQSLTDLQTNLSERLRQRGFSLENRKFMPHVTIGREVRVRNGFIQPDVPKVGFNVKSIELMVSEHIDGKLTYTAIYSSEL